MALTVAEEKSLDLLLWKLSTRLHRKEGGDPTDVDVDKWMFAYDQSVRIADSHLSCQFLEAMDSTVLLLYGCIAYALKKPPGLLKSTHSCSYGNPENSPSKTSFLGTCFSLKITMLRHRKDIRHPKSWMDYS